MGHVPKPLLVIVLITLLLLGAVGFGMGLKGALRKAATDEDEAALPGAAASSQIKDAVAISDAPPPPLAAKPKAKDAASDLAAASSLAVPALPRSPAPAESAPGAPPTPAPPTAAPPPARLPEDLPPT